MPYSNGTPFQYSCLEKPMDEGAHCSPWGREESDMTERLHFHFSLSCIGEGNGNPLQCSCLENPTDGGACWAAVYVVAQSQTQLKQLSSSRSILIKIIFKVNYTSVGGKKSLALCFSGVEFSFLSYFSRFDPDRNNLQEKLLAVLNTCPVKCIFHARRRF